MKRVEIISIGDELLIGNTLNTNATYIAKGLTAIGLEVVRITTIGDDADELRSALSEAMTSNDVTIMTGGLGPTHDDITKEIVADFFGSTLTLDETILDGLRRRFKTRGMEMASVNVGQAMVPVGADILNNPVGTAPGLLFTKNGKKCFVLPGVPAEMKAICGESVFTLLRGDGEVFLQQTIRTTGIAESTLFEKLGDISELQQFGRIAFLPKTAGVDIRVTVTGTHRKQCQMNLERTVALIQARAGAFIYASNDTNLVEIVAQKLVSNNQTISVAESCTGGLLANTLTNVSGSSAYFKRGVVTYNNAAKMDLLNVSSETLRAHGAVSEETAIEMARGILVSGQSDLGVSTTGIAGPTGGSDEKPVGLVYVGIATRSKACAKRFLFAGDRIGNKERTVQAALALVNAELHAL